MRNIHKPEPDKEIKTLKAFLLEPLSVERSLMCYTQPESLYFHFGTFSLLAKLVQVFLRSMLLLLSFAKGEKIIAAWATTLAECSVGLIV